MASTEMNSVGGINLNLKKNLATDETRIEHGSKAIAVIRVSSVAPENPNSRIPNPNSHFAIPMKLLEITFSENPTVDRDAGVIRGVKVLGRTSRNGREYSDRALAEAARFYEGIGVNLNHPDRRETAIERPV